MAAQNQQNTRHANLARIVVDGVVLAEAQNVSVQESGGTAPVRTIGSAYPHEHIHNAYDANVSIGSLAWYTTRLRKMFPGSGELIQLPTFDIEALDEQDNSVLWVAQSVTLASRSQSISANQPIQNNVSGMAIRVVDKDGAPSGNNIKSFAEKA